MEFIFELVLSVFWELVLQMAGELLLQLGYRTAAETFRHRRRAHPAVAAAGSLIVGSLLGVFTVAVLPQRVLGVTGVPGASLVLAPLANGAAMEAYGRWREDRERPRSYFATWWAGGLFAFGMALARFLLIEP